MNDRLLLEPAPRKVPVSDEFRSPERPHFLDQIADPGAVPALQATPSDCDHRWQCQRCEITMHEAALQATGEPPFGWHNDGDECIGPHCINMEHDEAAVATNEGDEGIE